MSALSSRKPRKRPHRKVRAPARPKAKMISFRLVVEAQEMVVSYRPNYFAGQGHLEFRSPCDPPRRIPVSQTGYLSHFAPMEEIEAAPSVEAYARAVALAMTEQKARPPSDPDQLRLF